MGILWRSESRSGAIQNRPLSCSVNRKSTISEPTWNAPVAGSCTAIKGQRRATLRCRGSDKRGDGTGDAWHAQIEIVGCTGDQMHPHIALGPT